MFFMSGLSVTLPEKKNMSGGAVFGCKFLAASLAAVAMQRGNYADGAQHSSWAASHFSSHFF